MFFSYRSLGASLCISGVIVGAVSYFIIDYALFVSAGIAMLLIGCTCIGISGTIVKLSPEACQLLLETGEANNAVLIEELSLDTEGIYLPSTMCENGTFVIFPLSRKDNLDLWKTKIRKRVIVRYGAESDDLAIAVITPGNTIVDNLKMKPEGAVSSIELIATHVLHGLLDIAKSVHVKGIGDPTIEVDIINPNLNFTKVKYYGQTGSPLASITAAIVCEALDKPICICNEDHKTHKSTITLRIFS